MTTTDASDDFTPGWLIALLVMLALALAMAEMGFFR
jgi:hypothetical protein